jgi:hypothetical protein
MYEHLGTLMPWYFLAISMGFYIDPYSVYV